MTSGTRHRPSRPNLGRSRGRAAAGRAAPSGEWQAELAQRLALAAAPRPVSPEEKLLRLLSVSGGYLALLAAYGCLLFLALR